MTEVEKFEIEVQNNINRLAGDKMLQNLSLIWLRDSALHKWSYNFRWMGRPAIQLPTDAWAMQELIWDVRPDLIIETGIAHGGSLVFYASMLALLDLDDSLKSGGVFDPSFTKRKVLGLDVDIRSHNRDGIDAHSMRPWIEMIEGSSISSEVIAKVYEFSKSYKRILVTLDSNHTHDHVLSELKAYAPLVSKGSYCVVMDTVLEDMPTEHFSDRPWAPGNSPKTAVFEYLKSHPEFEIDKKIDYKLLISVAQDGFLKRLT